MENQPLFAALAYAYDKSNPPYHHDDVSDWDMVREELTSVKSVTIFTPAAAKAALKSDIDEMAARRLLTRYDKDLHWLEFYQGASVFGAFVRRTPTHSWRMRLFQKNGEAINYLGRAGYGSVACYPEYAVSPAGMTPVATHFMRVMKAVTLHEADFKSSRTDAVCQNLLEWRDHNEFPNTPHPFRLKACDDWEVSLDEKKEKTGFVNWHAVKRMIRKETAFRAYVPG